MQGTCGKAITAEESIRHCAFLGWQGILVRLLPWEEALSKTVRSACDNADLFLLKNQILSERKKFYEKTVMYSCCGSLGFVRMFFLIK
jgi:hypothetical protein